MCFTKESIDMRWEIRLSPPIRDRELGGIIPFSNLWLQDYEEYDGAQIVSLFFLAREASHYHRSRKQRNVRPLLRNPRSRPSHCPRAHARATSISPRREPLVGGRKSRAHYDRRAANPCRPDTDAPEDARSRQETCHDRRTALGKFWPSRAANHRARTPAPHFALAALQSSKRIRRRPPAHHRIRHHRGRYQGAAPLFHAASLVRRTRLLPMVHHRRWPLRTPLQSMRRHKGVRRLSPLAIRSHGAPHVF